MKRIAFIGMCAGLMLATSCTNEDLGFSEGGTRVEFTIGLDGDLASRAISDGTGAKKLVYALYDENQNIITTLPGADETNHQVTKTDAFPSDLTDNVTLQLAKDQTYTIVFWAQNAECDAYTTTDLKNVQVNYEGLNNEETRDAFYAAHTFKVTGDAEIDVTLKRPFAQINVGVTQADWDAAVSSNIDITQSKAEFTGIPNTINLLDGSVSGSVDVTYNLATIPAKFETAEDLKVKTQDEGETEATEKTYKYLSMSYILADANVGTVDKMKFTLHPETGEDIIVEDGLSAVPFQRNWRTNILGQLLSSTVNFNIIIDPIYENDIYPGTSAISNGVRYDATNKTYYIYNASGLVWLRNHYDDADKDGFRGYTFKLATDIAFTNSSSVWNQCIGSDSKPFLGTFDGDGHTISNLKIKMEDKTASAGLFGYAYNVKNVTLVNPSIEGNWKVGGIVGNGLCANIENCHVEGGLIVSKPIDKDNANNVGGIVGYLSAEPNASVKNCSVSDVEIIAYRDLGGIVGTITGDNNIPVVENNTVSNVYVTANQICDYNEVKPANVGEICGRNLANAELGTNIATNVGVQTLTKPVENQPYEIGHVPLEVISDLADIGVSEIKLTSDVEGKPVHFTEIDDQTIYYGVILGKGMDFDGGGNSISVTSKINNTRTLTTKGGTVKNVTITNGFRGLMTDVPAEDVVIENVTIDGPGYALNTSGAATGDNIKLIVKNSTLKGWTSFDGGFVSAEFTGCNFGFGTYFKNPVKDGRMRPYINTTLTNCNFDKDFHLDFFKIGDGCKVILTNCKVGDTVLTADNISTLLSVDMPEGNTLADFVEFASLN